MAGWSGYRVHALLLLAVFVITFFTSVQYLMSTSRSENSSLRYLISRLRADRGLLVTTVTPTNANDVCSSFSSLRCIRQRERGHLDVLVKRPSFVEFVHQSWKKADLPPRFRKWSNTWRQCFPKARYILWTDVDNRNFVASHYPWFLARYDTLPANIYRADAMRYLYLFHFGGIYSDLDNECLRPFDHLLTNTSMVFGAMSGSNNVKEGYVQNSFMYSEARHPMWLELVHRIIKTSNGAAPEILTGPSALVAIINSYRKRMMEKAGITIYPPKYFNPFSWMTNKVKECKHFNLMNDTELATCRNTFINTSYVVQYHAHTWGGGKILRRL